MTFEIISIYGQNIPKEAVELQRKVYEKFGQTVKQLPRVFESDRDHGMFMNDAMEASMADVVLFSDIDNIPLNVDAVPVLLEAVKTRWLAGCAGRACHLNGAPYIGAWCLAIRREAWIMMKKPDFRSNSTEDTAGHVTRSVEFFNKPIRYFFPSSCEIPRWNVLGNKFGLGTNYEDIFYHAFESRGGTARFEKKCNEVLACS